MTKADKLNEFTATFGDLTRLSPIGKLRYQLACYLGGRLIDPPDNNDTYEKMTEATEGLSEEECQRWLDDLPAYAMTIALKLSQDL